jgi:glycine cleavage system transcriptional repressor
VAHFAVSAIGRDRPGIVAAIAAALHEAEGNVEDSRMTILGGHFSVMLVVSAPDSREAELRRRLGNVADDLGLEALSLSPLDELAAPAPAPSHVISVYGADHPGIVREVSGALAERRVNITDLQTRLAGAPEKPLYVMMLEIEADPTAIEEISAALAETGRRAEVEVSISRLETETL